MDICFKRPETEPQWVELLLHFSQQDCSNSMTFWHLPFAMKCMSLKFEFELEAAKEVEIYIKVQIVVERLT